MPVLDHILLVQRIEYAVTIATEQLVSSDQNESQSAKNRGRIQGLRQVLKMIEEITGEST